ncbi:hypothetical protein [Deinococcus puniceus]|uniref:Uncharacterized protein n=1 Tax=Deinococcus puniceus TaxID=1182568 RepID=A0A172TAA3_9DEIO|nr:hypothetical protein [Deinococcus puniceus]ANE43866.1 hypothetical protein SU48_08840 [Deinococcus puniceus]
MVSILKRRGWIAGVGAVALLLGLQVSLGTGVLLGFLSPLAITLCIGAQSIWRHRGDWHARSSAIPSFLNKL